MEASSLSYTEFRKMVVRILKELSDDYKELSENYNSINKDIGAIKNNHSEMNKIMEMKTTLEAINSRLDQAEYQISNLETR